MGYKFLVAAFCCTWAIHLVYLLWIGIMWRNQQTRIDADRNSELRREQTV
jgi:hypothetical protein